MEMESVMECNVCLNKFKNFELQNPRWCCSVRLCKDCYGKTDSCPQCRNDNDNHENIDLTGIVEVEDNKIIFTRIMGKYREVSTCDIYGFALWTEYLDNNKKYYQRGNKPNYIMHLCDRESHNWLNSDGEPHREDGPAAIRFDINGKIIMETYMIDGKHQQRGALPNCIAYKRMDNGDIEYYSHSWYNTDGELDRGDDPTIIKFRPDGTVIQETYGHDRQFDGNEYGLPIEFSYYPNGNPRYKNYIGKRTYYYEDGKERHIETYDRDKYHYINTLFNRDGSILTKYIVELDEDGYHLIYEE